MSAIAEPVTADAAAPAASPAVDLEVAADEAIAACGGDARETVKALVVTLGFLEAEIEDLRGAVSSGYTRQRYAVPRDDDAEKDRSVPDGA